MKISRNSWHYRVVNKIFRSPSKSLCIYFWQIPFSIISFTISILVLGVIGVAAGVTILIILSAPVIVNVVPLDPGVALALGLMSFMIWTGVLAEIHKHYNDKPWNKVLFRIKRRKTPKEKKESIFFAYLKAKKDKVCPTIEFHYGEN